MSNKIFYPLLVVLCFTLLWSCDTAKRSQRQATKNFNKAVNKSKPTVAKLTRNLFPCIETAADSVSVTDTLYDIISVECPPNEGGSYDPQIIYKDGKVITRTNTVQVKVPAYIRTTVTKKYTIEDSAKIYSMQIELDKVTAKADKNGGKLDWWRKACLITWGLILLAGGGWFIRKKIK